MLGGIWNFLFYKIFIFSLCILLWKQQQIYGYHRLAKIKKKILFEMNESQKYNMEKWMYKRRWWWWWEETRRGYTIKSWWYLYDVLLYIYVYEYKACLLGKSWDDIEFLFYLIFFSSAFMLLKQVLWRASTPVHHLMVWYYFVMMITLMVMVILYSLGAGDDEDVSEDCVDDDDDDGDVVVVVVLCVVRERTKYIIFFRIFF